MSTALRYLNRPASRFVEEQALHVVKADLSASDATAGVLSLLNATGRDLFIKALTLRITTKSTGAGTLDAGVASTEASNDTLLDGLDVNAATGDFDNITDKGTNGKAQGKLWPNGYYLTASKASGAMAGLVGQALIVCCPI